MSCLEKRLVSHKANMQHSGYLDNFMDETDREVMNLTDRAFKSLCIGDEAIYNDSEFSPSPVSCHKPLTEEVLKKTRENSSSASKKHGAHPINGAKNTLWQFSKGSSLFSAFTAGKNGDSTKKTNGESWDKSALLSIQKELSEFSSDLQNNLAVDHGSQVSSHYKSTERSNKSSKDMSTQSGKTTKSKHGKSSKLKKLNSQNFFLHSEFSPFQSWRDLNKFPFELDGIEIFQNNRPPEWYDSPLYKKLTMSHRLHTEAKKERECQNTSLPALPDKREAKVSQQQTQTEKTMPLETENHTEIRAESKPQVLLPPSVCELRCQSEGDHCAPWRKNRHRTKSGGQSILSSLACERANPESALPKKKEVKMMEEQASSSTPFNISQLLTPVIPSRQGTGSSEILQAFLSPSTLDLPPLSETEKRPSPEIKRENYKSMASSLLFNLKDNRKRVKAMYSPPKFKGLDSADQNKLSPLIKQVSTTNTEEMPEIPNTTITSPAPEITEESPVSLLPVQHNSPQNGPKSGCLLDDYLALSLLQAGPSSSPIKPLKSKKATYPSLNLYPKAASTGSDTKENVGPRPTTEKTFKQGQDVDCKPEKDGKEYQEKHGMTTPAVIQNKTIDSSDKGSSTMNCSKAKITTGEIQTVTNLKEKYPLAFLNKDKPISDALIPSSGRNQDKLSTETGKLDQDCLRKEPKPKHVFSSRQNNYIKSQRYMSVDELEEDFYGEEEVGSEVVKDNNNDVRVREVVRNKQNIGVHKAKEHVDGKPDGNDELGIKGFMNVSAGEKKITKNDSFSMKGNTYAKRALFMPKEKEVNKTAPKKESIVFDKFDLAKAALEEVIAEREQRKKQSQTQIKKEPDLGNQEEYKQVSMDTLTSRQKNTLESFIEGRRGQKVVDSDFKPSSQIVQSVSEMETKHGQSHVAEVNLAGPCKQEGTSGSAAGQIKYTERERSGRGRRQSETDNVKPLDKVTEHKEKELVFVKESSRVSDTNSYSRQGEGSTAKKKSPSYKPDIPPRRGRASSQNEERLAYETAGEDAKKSVLMEESLSRKVKANLPKDRGPVRGHVSNLKERFDRGQRLQSIDVQECLTQRKGPKVNVKNDTTKQMSTDVPESALAPETASAKNNYNATEMNSEKESGQALKPAVRDVKTAGECDDAHSTEVIGQCVMSAEKEDANKTELECAAEVFQEPDDKQDTCIDQKDNSGEDFLGISGKSGVEKEQVKPGSESQNEITAKTPEISESVQNDTTTHSIMVYDILQESKSLDKQLDSSQKTEAEERKGEEKSEITSEPSISERILSPPSDVEKGGWVRCLIESARNLTPTSQSNASSPMMGKPALFKVKDNTFSASPVTKTVRPILHKTIPESMLPWSPRESLSGSERGEDLFKDCVELQSPTVLSPTPPCTPVRSPQLNLSLLPLLSSPATQLTTIKEGKEQMDTLTIPEEDERQSGVSSVSEGIESCGTSTGDITEESTSLSAPADGTEESKAPSERSGSACSGFENQSQCKPPVVPPKSEKALRRAMKLTTRRIQKTEAKPKTERKGRSSEKSVNPKPERRHHSTDGRTNHRAHSIDQSAEENNEKLWLRAHRRERHEQQESQSQEKDAGGKPQHESHGFRAANEDARTCIKEERILPRTSEALGERLGRTTVKHSPDKLDRRAQSLDRFLGGKPALVSRMNSEPSANPCTLKRSPLRQNSLEHTYPATPANIITQSFPMTQRKLLQDPDSGQYFVVDMPVQVKTKTFFDPETGSYVQLPVPSPETPKAKSIEVLNAPPLVLYHGFVPVSVSSLPAPKSTINLGSVLSPVESSEMERHEDIYQQCKAVGRPYLEPSHTAQEHLAQDGISGVS